MMIASGRIATSVFRVSTSDSPFDTLEPCADIDTMSAPRCLAAISKLTRVRVEASKNRLTTVRPRSVSNASERFTAVGLEEFGAVEDGFDFGSGEFLDAEQAGFRIHEVVVEVASAMPMELL